MSLGPFAISLIRHYCRSSLPSSLSYARLARRMATESPAVIASRTILASIDLSKYDPEQSRLMDERCILVDENDRALGAADKKTCTSSHISQARVLQLIALVATHVQAI